jgi:signal peptidase I
MRAAASVSEGTATALNASNATFRSAAAKRAVNLLWEIALPAACAGVVLWCLVPVGGSGLRGFVATLGHAYPLAFGVALFLAFSAIVHYWRGQFRDLASTRTAADDRADAPAVPARKGVVPLRPKSSQIAAILGVAIGVALVFRTYVAQPYRVLSASMLPTLEPDDLVAGTTRPYSNGTPPRRGDVVVFASDGIALGARGASMPPMLVKRVIGLPGDRITMRGGEPVINGWPVPNCDAGPYIYVLPDVGDVGVHGRLRVEFLDDRAYLTVQTTAIVFPDEYVVKSGEVFVLGDNRGNSADSRSYNNGHGGGVALGDLQARVQWFLAGTHRTGTADLTRLFRSIDALQLRLRLEGVRTQPIEEGIARCLRGRPANTTPPLSG